MQRQPDDGRNIAQAEANAESAAQKVFSQDKILAEEIDKLEQKKLNDMKNILKEYTHIQLIFHAKALEMLSIAYRELMEINTDNDLEEFRNTFTQSNLATLKGSRQSLNSSYQKSYDNMFSGGSAPNTPRGSRTMSQQQIDSKRSKSNENLKAGLRPGNATKNSSQYQSAPHLNNQNNDSMNSSRLNKSKQMEVEDITDDSEDED